MEPTDAFICDAIRTPFGRYGGALSVGAHRRPRRDPAQGADGAQPQGRLGRRSTTCIYGCANQAGEDNRNVARMAALLAGLPLEVPGATINRLCGSGLDAVGTRGARHQGRRGRADDRRRRREHEPRAVRDAARPRARSRAANAVYDTTIGWRFVNKLMKEQYGVDSMPETAENVADRLQDRARGAGPHGAGVAAEGGGGAEDAASSTPRSCR